MEEKTNSKRLVAAGVLLLLLGGILHSYYKEDKVEIPQEREKEVVEVVVADAEPQPDIIEVAVSEEEDSFFPKDPQDLKEKIKNLLLEAPVEKSKGSLVGIITPHASLEYSGKIAAAAYKQLEGKSFDTVVILVPNHNEINLQGVVICPKGKWKTPLGKVEVDEKLARALKRQSSEFTFSKEPFEKEHSLEVQLPFLQSTLKKFKILPVMIGGRSIERSSRLADALAQVIDKKKVLLLATTHLSRGESYQTTKRLDFIATSSLQRCDSASLRRYEREGLLHLCGYSSVLTLIYFLKEMGIDEGVLLDYANSADITGKRQERIVGYASLMYAQKK